MARTTSLAFPNMFTVTQNSVAVLKNEIAVVNRDRLLILTEPTEVYNEPTQGVGLKKYLFTYNNENQKALIKQKIVEQLRLHEPYCDPDETQFAEGNLFTGSAGEDTTQKYNKLELTVSIKTVFGASLDVVLDSISKDLL